MHNTIPVGKQSFQHPGLGNCQDRRKKLNATKFSDILNENSGPQTFQQDNDPEHTAETVQEWLREDSVNVLEWPNQSLNFTQIKKL